MRTTDRETVDFEVLLTDPAGYYGHPSAIVEAAGLSRRQRLMLLEEWAQSILDDQLETGQVAVTGATAAQTRLLGAIDSCLARVEDSPGAPPTLLERVWRRVTD